MPFTDTILSEHMPEGLFLIPGKVFRPSCMGKVSYPLHPPGFP